MPAGYSFRPRAWAIALAAAACAAGIALGNWQSERAAQKQAAGTTAEQIVLRGRFDPQYTVLLDNKIYRGRPGYHIVQPFQLPGARHVLVNRGWAPAGASRDQLPEFRTAAGEIAVSGLRLRHFPQAYAPPGSPSLAKPAGKVWQNVTLEQFAAWSGLTLEPYVIEQHGALDDGLVRDWPRADAGVETHQSYALQWYSLAALSVALLLVLNIRREKSDS